MHHYPENIYKICSIILISFLLCNVLHAQQNCNDAIPICQNSYSQVNVNAGVGSIADLNSSNHGCLTGNEVNSSWYILNASTAGNVVFTITPNSATDDYDFAVWDITDTSCAALANGLVPIRCNYALLGNSTAGGLTGLNTTATATSLGGGGPSFCSAITAVAGQTFLIVVNNNSASTNGYTINFAGSTAQILDNVAPAIKSIIVPPSCNGSSAIKLLLKENIKCNSIAINGSDFSISSGYTINSAIGGSCASGGVYTSSVVLNFNTALATGTYTCTINTGADGNTLVDNCNNAIAVGTTFTFTVLPPVKVLVQPQFGCSGSASGTITASGTGGYLPYKFKLNNGVFNTANSFSGLTAGTYTISIKDSLGCIKDTVLTLSAAPPIVLNTVNSVNLTCFNSANGSITINAAGGNAPLNYAVNSNAYTSSNFINNLNPGTYVVHTKDANGCLKDTVILITSPGQINGNVVTITNVTCIGLSNGIINYTANGGTLPLQYALNNGTYTAFANYNNLAIGVYTLHIKDANNCLKDTVITITQPSMVLTVVVGLVLQPNCSGTTGSISFTGMGGTAPYSYSINGITYTATNTFTGLAAGSYIIYAKDAGGCVATSAVVLASPGNLGYNSASIIQPTCLANGSITVTGFGGTAPLTYAIGSGGYSINNTFGNLASGSYTLHVKDNNNCIHDTIINLVLPSIPQVTISTIGNATCSNPTSGFISVSAAGGAGNKTYAINNSTFGVNSVFNNLSAGVYTIVVKDINGCTSNVTATLISNNTMAFASVMYTNVGCNNSPLGSISVTGIGGVPAYQYKINNNTLQASGSFTGLNGGVYTITVQDASGCTKTTLVTIQSSGNFSLTNFVATNAICSNPGNGSISSTFAGGVAPIIYNLNGNLSSNSNFNLLQPGTYTLTATDANGCSISSATTITGPPKLWFINTTVVIPPCFGGIGSILTNGIGGLPPYTFSLNTNPYTTSSSFLNLQAGTYVVHLQDANGCIHDTTIVLIQPNPVSLNNVLVSNAACSGAATGSISAVASGTIAPYLYSINGGVFSNTNTFSNLTAGTYTIVVKDANNCSNAVVSSINNNGNFYFNTFNAIRPLCVGANNGSISFSAIGGSMPYTYKINNGAFQSSNNFIGLAAGTYTLFVQDNAGCIVSQLATISPANALFFNSIITTPPLCNNGSNASVSVSGNGIPGSFTYKIDGGSFVTSTLFSGLSSGTHTVSIKNGNGCITDSVIQISNPTAIQFSSVTAINAGCFGPGNGSIIVAGSGGSMPYAYQLNSGLYINSGAYNALTAGVYTVAIKDANNCSTTTIIAIANVAGVNVSTISKIFSTCLNTNNGSIFITANSSNNPINFTLNNGTPNTTGNFSGLAVGNFSIHITDALGCFKDSIIYMGTQSSLKIDSTKITKTLCFGDSSGTATLFTSGGNGTMTYAVNNLAYTSNALLNGLTNTTYTLHARDNIGCIVDTVITISSPPKLFFASSNLIAPFCNGSQDGTISIGGLGGVLPYLYNINANPYSTSTLFSNLIQGVYTFHIKDANGCITDTSMFLQGPDIVYFSSFISNNVTCFGASNGSATAIAAGGTSPYQYSLNNNAFTTSNQFNNLPIGNYTLIAVDNQGCIKDTIFDIVAPTSNVGFAGFTIISNKCRGDSSASVGIIPNGGTAPYLMSFNTPATFTNVTQYNNLTAGNYMIYIKDANGCTNDSTIKITEPDSSAQIFLLNSILNSCVGVNDGALIVSAKNGYTPYQYLLDGISQGADSVFNNLVYGDYVVEVVDSIGCRSTGKYFVDSTKKISSIVLTNLVQNVCKYDTIGQAAWVTINTYPPVLSSVNGGNFALFSNLQLLPNGSYTLQIKDDKGCRADTTFTISGADSVTITVTTTDALCDGNGNDGKAEVLAKNGVLPFTYIWSAPQPTNTNNIDNLKYGDYSIVVVDNLGCIDSASFNINYFPCCAMFIPNAFTPNNDIINDKVVVKPSGPIEFISLQIFNRWGETVFNTTDQNIFWDGKQNGQDCKMDVYFYVLKYKCPLLKNTSIKKGDITLIR
jgi:large repetitive protein